MTESALRRAVMPPELISIITPSFNSAEFLSDAIESVMGQSYPYWELLVVDDKSTDHSIDIAESYAKRDARIKVIVLREHGGAAVARNVGIKKAKGRYIGFLDSDDCFYRDKLTWQLNFMWLHQYALTHTYYQIINEKTKQRGRTIKPPNVLTYWDMLRANQIGCSTAIYDSSKVGKVYMPLIKKRQDYGLWLRILKGGGKAHCFPSVLSLYRVRSNSISSNKAGLLRYNWRLLREFEGFNPLVSAYYISFQVLNALTRNKITWRSFGT